VVRHAADAAATFGDWSSGYARVGDEVPKLEIASADVEVDDGWSTFASSSG
jgi:hypothetical protein